MCSFLLTGVEFQDGGLPLRRIDVGVDFRCEDALVSQHLLDGTQVSPVFEKVAAMHMFSKQEQCVKYSGKIQMG